MDVTLLADCIERIRSYCVSSNPEVGVYLARLRRTDYRTLSAGEFQVRLLGQALDLDDSTPQGRRRLATLFHQLQESTVVVGEPGSHAPRQSSPAALPPEVHGLPARDQEELLQSFQALEGGGSPPGTAGPGCEFARFLAREPGVSSAVGFVGKTLPALTGQSRYEFLTACGYPAPVPAASSMRLLSRLGLWKQEGSDKAAERSFCAAVEHLARAACLSISELDLLLRVFSGGRRFAGVEPVCSTRPDCEACPVSSFCGYFHREYRPSAPSARDRSIKTWNADERPRERLLSGERLTNAELLAIILRTGSGGRSAVDLARELLARYGTLHRLADAPPAELAKIRGLGPAKAAQLLAALEIGRRSMQLESDGRDGLRTITTSRDVFDHFRTRFKNASQEEFLLLTLNTKNRITREIVISRGTLNASIVHPRDVFNSALREAAAAVVFVHNHPSGDPAPSREDRTLTARLAEAGRLLGIRVLDHVIVGATRYYSFADEGELG